MDIIYLQYTQSVVDSFMHWWRLCTDKKWYGEYLWWYLQLTLLLPIVCGCAASMRNRFKKKINDKNSIQDDRQFFSVI